MANIGRAPSIVKSVDPDLRGAVFVLLSF